MPCCSSSKYWGELTINGTLHLRARHYTPGTGTFTTRDPLDGVDGTTTLTGPYHYVNNDPFNMVDPLGIHPGVPNDSDNGTPSSGSSAGDCGPNFCSARGRAAAYDHLVSSGSQVDCSVQIPHVWPFNILAQRHDEYCWGQATHSASFKCDFSSCGTFGIMGIDVEIVQLNTYYQGDVDKRTIRVNSTIAGEIRRMLDDAYTAGVVLYSRGRYSSFGSHDMQQELRDQNGCTASGCRVETAKPGFSNHETGNAVDFEVTDSLWKGCNQWLVKNSQNYGMHNYPPEPWHYSTNGK